MLRKRRSRRALALTLIILGGVLIFLAPALWTGLTVLILGVVVELIGIALEHRA